VVQVGCAIRQEELAIKHIEGHVAEGKQLKEELREVQDSHAQECCIGPLP
jgi:hypothetical protein